MKNTAKLCVFSILFIFFFSSITPASTNTSDIDTNDIRLVATQQLATWLDKIPIGQEQHFGFADRDEFAAATIGTPVHTFYFADELETKVNELLVPSFEWRVPVLVNNEYRALLTVAPVEGVLNIVDLGAAGLARELGTQTGHKNVLLRSFKAKCDFLVADHNGKGIMLMPLQSARRNLRQLDHASKDVFTIDEIRGMILFPENKPGVAR
jgi:hypothetical protein